jgi:hypothetical protein
VVTFLQMLLEQMDNHRNSKEACDMLYDFIHKTAEKNEELRGVLQKNKDRIAQMHRDIGYRRENAPSSTSSGITSIGSASFFST